MCEKIMKNHYSNLWFEFLKSKFPRCLSPFLTCCFFSKMSLCHWGSLLKSFPIKFILSKGCILPDTEFPLPGLTGFWEEIPFCFTLWTGFDCVATGNLWLIVFLFTGLGFLAIGPAQYYMSLFCSQKFLIRMAFKNWGADKCRISKNTKQKHRKTAKLVYYGS